jgi:hypothetical protein
MSKVSIIKELIEFSMQNKKWWITPILFFLIIFGSLIILAEGSALAPFIYAIF